MLLGSAVTEGVAGFDLAVRQASFEPRHPLGRGSVRERLSVDATRSGALKPIIADGSRRVQSLLDIALLQDATLLRAVGPDTRKTIRLKLQPDRHGIRPSGILLLKAARLCIDPEQMLHVMSQLVSEHVRLREIA